MNAPPQKPKATIGTMTKRKMMRKWRSSSSRSSVVRPTSMMQPSGRRVRAMVQTMCCSEEGTLSQSVLRGTGAEMGQRGLVLLGGMDELQVVGGADDFQEGRFAFPAAFVLEMELQGAAPPCTYQARQASSLARTISRSMSRSCAGEAYTRARKAGTRRRRRRRCTRD